MNLRDHIEAITGILTEDQYNVVVGFISDCDLVKFEKLKDIEYDESTAGYLDDI